MRDNRKRTFRMFTFLVSFLLPVGLPQFSPAQQKGNKKDARTLIEEARISKDKQKIRAVDNLGLASPESKEDVSALREAVHGNDAEVQEAAAHVLRNVSPDATNLSTAYVALLDDKSEKVQAAAIHACAKLKAKEAAPKILDLLSKQPRAKFTAVNLPWMTREHMDYVDEAAQALVDLDHFQAIDEILSRDELMVNSGFGGPLVARYGAKVLPKVLDMIRKNDTRKNGGIQAIVFLRDEAAVPDLIALLDDSDNEVAGAATHSLSEMPAQGATVGLIAGALRRKLQSPNQFIRGSSYAGLLRLVPKDNLPLAMEAVKKDSLVRLEIFYALIRNPVPEAVPYLKEFIQENEKREPNWTTDREVAAQAIYKISGEKVPYRGVDRLLKLYDQGLRPDPYEPSGKGGIKMKSPTLKK